MKNGQPARRHAEASGITGGGKTAVIDRLIELLQGKL